MKKVLITGVTGQDGSFMADFLLSETDNVIVGGIRRLSKDNHENIEHLKGNPRFKLVDLDVTDQVNTERVIEEEKPDYFINFAANSFVGNSWDMPVNHMMTNAMPVLYQLEAIKKHVPNCRYYNAGSSEQFGDVDYSPQDINHPFKPRSPYGVSKCTAHHLVKVYRESYDIYAVQGILFNHEGTRRGHEFVTRKITREVSRVIKEIEANAPVTPLELGNLSAERDWSDAEDFVKGVWMMLHQPVWDGQDGKTFGNPRGALLNVKDYILSSNETHEVREFVKLAFRFKGYDIIWKGRGERETGEVETHEGRTEVVKVNPSFSRPAEVQLLLGDSTPARKELGWKPNTNFEMLVAKMMMKDYHG